MNTNKTSIAVFIVSVLALMLLVMRKTIIAVETVGITIQILSFLLMIWARMTFGFRSFHAAAGPTDGGLVTRGPYRFIRHPIYSAILYFMWTGIFSHLSLADAGLGIVVTVCSIIRMVSEERLLVSKYPEYASYSSRTKRILPYII